MKPVYKILAIALALAVTVIGAMSYDEYRTEQQAFEAMGEAQMLREQLREQTK